MKTIDEMLKEHGFTSEVELQQAIAEGLDRVKRNREELNRIANDETRHKENIAEIAKTVSRSIACCGDCEIEGFCFEIKNNDARRCQEVWEDWIAEQLEKEQEE